ncbi:MAG: ATP-dependent zinc metalloprotease FtsH [Oscillospiraceae bacterium]|nr:ATP-dependent zinc metalloprotease FtsH [Oscillospiraceae bacterium]MDD6084635.1 ATP-dependent zinc metalloprotease FtsH [Oscillospiraceae bacterium]MDY3256885.1 ATP-dependent zinc metalloprotease FtsH [Ruminococcus callidus]
MQRRNKNRGIVTYLVIAAVLVLCMMFVIPNLTSSSSKYKYSDIMKYFDNYKVTEYTLDLGTGKLNMTLDDGQSLTYNVPNVSLFLDDTKDYRTEYNAKTGKELSLDYFKIKDNTWILSLLPTLLLLALGVVLLVVMMKQANGGKYTSFGKANIKEGQQGRTATFADVAGAEEEKQELQEIVEYLKFPDKFTSIGAKIPKGVLLMGPPGTGKTLLARAVAGEAGCPFYPISGSDFVEMFVGVGASRVRDLFNQAKKNAPAIIFIDEIDAVGRQRGAGLGGGNDEREQTLNQLLVEMDGFSGKESVIVIAATNRRDILDPALLRPGRFDRQVVVGYPDVKGREAILKVHTRNKPLAPDVDLRVIAQSTAGFTGADLENLVNEAALLAARKDKKALTMEEIQEATIKVVAGPEKKSREITIKEKRLTAYHEAGHAVCHFYTPHTDDVHEVSIIPRGMAGGYTMSLPETDKSFVTKKEMEENIIALLGGRVAEQIFLDDISTGASNDLERATKTARSMVTKYGFSEKIGPVVYGGNDQDEVFLGRDFNSPPSYSDEVASKIDSEVRNIVENAYAKTAEILHAHEDQMHLLAKYLLRNEKIERDDFKHLMEGTMDKETIAECMKEDTDFYAFPVSTDAETEEQ